MKKQLSSQLGVEFYPTDTYAHGYPIETLALGTQPYTRCLWLIPNRVQRGFVRSDDERYDELKNLMPGEALRYPEVPADAYILSVSDTVRNNVLEACSSCRLQTQPLRELVDAT